MADEVLAVEARLKDYISGNLKKIEGNMSKMATKGEAQFRKLNSTTSKLTSGVKSLVGAYMGFRGLTMVLSFAKEATRLFMIQEEAEIKLAQAMKSTGEFTEEAFQSNLDYAASLQGLTTVGDETSIKIMQLGLTMGVAADQIQEATKESIALSKAFGVELTASMKMVALARAGEFSMLGRYIPQLRTTTDKVEQLAIFNKAMADGFKIAEAETKTYTGQLEQMANQVGDLKEEIGKEMIPTQLAWNKAMLGGVKILRMIVLGLSYQYVGIKNLLSGKSALNTQLARGVTIDEKLLSIEAQLDLAFSKKASSEGAEIFRKKLINQLIRERNILLEQQSKKEIKGPEVKKPEVEEIIPTLAPPKEAADVWKTYYSELDNAQKMFAESKIALMQEGFDRERAELDLWYEEQKTKYKDNEDALSLIHDAEANKRQMITRNETEAEITMRMQNAEANRKEHENKMALLSAEKAMRMQNIASFIATSAQIANTFKDDSEAMFNLSKGLNMAMAIMNTAQAVTKALTAGPIMGPIMATVIGALGAIQVAKIASTGFAQGTPYSPAGMALVGERGPEMVNLPQGARVYNNNETKNMITNNKPTVIVVNGGGDIGRTIEAATRDRTIDWNRILVDAGVMT